MKQSIIIFSVAVGLLNSCCSSKKVQRTIVYKDSSATPVITDRPKEDSAAFIREQYRGIIGNKIDFTTFSAKADMEYNDGNGKKYNVNANIRIYKDSIIWLSVTAIFGIEGARIYITPDSVKMLDKQNKLYTVRSVSYLQELTGLPLTISSVQDLLVGNPVFLDSNISYYSKTPGNISLLSQGSFFINLLTINETDKLIQDSKLTDSDTSYHRTCYLSYSEYEKKKEVNFSTKRNINVSDKKKLDIKLSFRQYDFNETLSFPFNIPKNYTRN